MGSILSKIDDDMDDYEAWCIQYGETMGELYGAHYDWLRARSSGTTTLSFEQYEREREIRMLRYNLVQKQEQILRIERDMGEILNKLNALILNR